MAALLLELVCTHIKDPSELVRYLVQLSRLLIWQERKGIAHNQIQAAARWDNCAPLLLTLTLAGVSTKCAA